jgi:hypothetical protein
VKEQDPVGLLTQFGIEIHFTTPYSGQSKPIERSFRDLESRIGTSRAFRGAYVGSNPMDKPFDAGTRVIPLADFEAVVAAGIQDHNARLGRGTRACGGKLSFDQAFKDSYDRALITIATEEQIRQALLCVEGVKVRQNGHGLVVGGNRYWGDFLLGLVGQKVAARFDPDDMHAGVHVYSLTGVFLGSADCQAKIGFASLEQGREHLRRKKKLERTAKDLRAAELALVSHQETVFGPEFTEEEIRRPVVVRGFFPGSAAAHQLQVEDDQDLMEAELIAFNRAVVPLRVDGEDD